jgi:predicted O-methyltransferase YrrM
MSDGIVAYTAIFGGYDALEPTAHGELCLTDGDVNAPPGWRFHTVYAGRPPRWANRRCKILVHDHVDAECSIYHDGNVKMLASPQEAVERWLGDADLAVFRHPESRDCAYQEAEETVRQHKAQRAVVDAQMARYREEGFPEHFGLSACYVLVRRHTGEVQEFNKLWWREYQNGAKRDQLSFDYLRWKTGLRVNWIPGNLFEGTSPDFTRTPHRRVDSAQLNWQTAYGKMLLPEERRYLVDSAARMQKRFDRPNIVNIGVFRCASMYCLRAGAPRADLLGVDIKPCDVPIEPGLRAEFIVGDSAVVHAQYGKPIHLLFIDGDHRYEAVKADLERWGAKVAPGGLVVMHDYGAQPKHLLLDPELGGVRRAAMEWHQSDRWDRLQAPGSLAAYRKK